MSESKGSNESPPSSPEIKPKRKAPKKAPSAKSSQKPAVIEPVAVKEKKPPSASRLKKKEADTSKTSDKPKRAPSAYNVFFKDQYAKLKAKGGLDSKQIVREIGKLWTAQKAKVSSKTK